MTRTEAQIVAAAGNADRALAAGLPAELLVALAVARQRLDAGQPLDTVDGLSDALSHPAADLYDHVLVRRLRGIAGVPKG